jgi:hypothetical protein
MHEYKWSAAARTVIQVMAGIEGNSVQFRAVCHMILAAVEAQQEAGDCF